MQQGVAQAQGALNIGQMAAQLNSQNFDQAQAAATGDITRNLQAQEANQSADQANINSLIAASTGLGGLGAQAQQNQRQQFLELSTAGAQQQQQAQNQINAKMNQFNQANAYPTKQLGILQSALGMTPYGSTTMGSSSGQQTTTTTPSTMSDITGGLQALGGAFGAGGPFASGGALAGLMTMSDRHLKTDIVKIGVHQPTGLPIYSYRYKGDPKILPQGDRPDGRGRDASRAARGQDGRRPPADRTGHPRRRHECARRLGAETTLARDPAAAHAWPGRWHVDGAGRARPAGARRPDGRDGGEHAGAAHAADGADAARSGGHGGHAWLTWSTLALIRTSAIRWRSSAPRSPRRGSTPTSSRGCASGQEQQELYANYQAGRAGQPLPYPARGSVPLAAAPGTSIHERGLAADIQPVNPADLPKMYALASQYGIQPLGAKDPYHFQLANWQQAEATQGPSTPWDQTNPANVPTRYAMNMEANAPSAPGRPVSATPIPGGSSHADFIRSYANSIGLDPNLALGIANAEGLRAWSAKNPNAASTVDVQNGQPFSFGDFQLNIRNGLGTQALKGGIDPRDPNQWQAADKFALDQMKAGGVGPWKGDAFAKQYLATGNVPALPAMPGTTLNSAPTTPAGGPGAPAAPGQPGQPSGGMAASLPGYQPNSPGAKMTAKGLQQLAGGDQGSGGGEAPPMQPPMQLSARAASGPMMMGPGGQNAAGQAAAQQALAQQGAQYGFLTQPSLAAYAPPARLPVPGAMPIAQASGVGMGLPGTTLNSPSQLQMALMTGALSPYDLYGNSAAGFGSQSYGQ